jgi:hypothetical protein
MSVLIWLSDFVWEWKLLSWPLMLAALVLLWFSRNGGTAVVVAVAPYVRYGLMILALGSVLIFCLSFFSTGKGQDRLTHVPLGLSLIPLWTAGLVAALLVPRTA